MGILDNMKDLKDKAEEFAADHEEQVTEGVEKASDFIDDKTGGRFEKPLDTVTDKVADYVEKLDGDAQS
jgi:hypothetical protein